MKRLLCLALIVLLSAVGGVVGNAQEEAEVSATVVDAEENELGTVSFMELDEESARDMDIPAELLEGGVGVWAQLRGLPPGFHGFHVHSVGTCDPSGDRAFASAGGHLHADGESHGGHMGDLPALYVSETGLAVLVFLTDGFTLADLLDADGSAVIIHAGPDNYGNIPADRYDPDADETTLSTGDAGGRIACGVIQSG